MMHGGHFFKHHNAVYGVLRQSTRCFGFEKLSSPSYLLFHVYSPAALSAPHGYVRSFVSTRFARIGRIAVRLRCARHTKGFLSRWLTKCPSVCKCSSATMPVLGFTMQRFHFMHFTRTVSRVYHDSSRSFQVSTSAPQRRCLSLALRWSVSPLNTSRRLFHVSRHALRYILNISNFGRNTLNACSFLSSM